MTAARLSPAANLLRNSKLFALPPAIALPNPDPSSEPVPRSDTATTIYPTRAAVETPFTSLAKGDWGFKRQLPLKSTTRSGSPSVRLNKGIDTAEHIADFDSAADHVLTLKKFQELNIPIQYPNNERSGRKVHHGVFRPQYDNTSKKAGLTTEKVEYSGVWPSLSSSALRKHMPEALQSETVEDKDADQVQTQSSAKPSDAKRWRYNGPSLVQMSGLEFDQWIKGLDAGKRQAFRELVKQDMLIRKRRSHTVKAQDEGTVGEIDVSTLQISEEEVSQHIRKLRQHPESFGRLIAEFLDLPPGPSTRHIIVDSSKTWDYGSNNLAAERYADQGPPRTHPSAGLSYIHNARWAQNHAVFGPQNDYLPVVARQVKTVTRGGRNRYTLGVGGFIVHRESHMGTREAATLQAFEPQPNGQKTTVRPVKAEFDVGGALKLSVKSSPEYEVENDKAVHNSMLKDTKVAPTRRTPSMSGSRVMPALARSNRVEYKKRDDLVSPPEDDFEFLGKTR